MHHVAIPPVVSVCLSVLGPILFIIYIKFNDLVEYCGSNADILFADDAKIFSHIKTDQDIKQLAYNVS